MEQKPQEEKLSERGNLELATKLYTQTEKHTHHSTTFPLCPRCLRSNAYVKTVGTTPGLPNTDRRSFVIILAATNTGRTTASTHT